MADLKLAWRNVWRHPRRTGLTVAAIAFACLLLVFMLSFQFGSYATMIDTAVRIRTGHFQIQAEGYQDKPQVRDVVVDPDAVTARLDRLPEVKAHTRRAEAFGLLSSEARTYGALVVGIDPERERAASSLAHLVRRGRFLEPGDADDALIGELLARNLRVDVGDALTLLGQGRDGSVAATVLTVRGVYRSGQDDFDRSAVQMPLETFDAVFSMRGAVHTVVGVCYRLEQIDTVRRKVADALPQPEEGRSLVFLDWQQLMPGLHQGIEMDLISGFIFYLVLIMVVAFSILNTFLMAIFERTREFGVLMAIGTRPRRLMRLVLLESSLMTAVGIAGGILLGCLVTIYFQARGIELSGAGELLRQYGIPGRIHPRLSVLSATIGPAAVLLITVAAAFFPALRLRRLKPVEAMRAT